jgi:hypothetical protein
MQYIVLSIGTIVFTFLIYTLVQIGKGKSILFNTTIIKERQTTEPANIYTEPDKNSAILGTVLTETKIITSTETKFYFKADKVFGYEDLNGGYILKRQLKSTD